MTTLKGEARIPLPPEDGSPLRANLMAHILPDEPRPRAWEYPAASPSPQCPHGTSYPQPCHGCGWVCPTCKRAYAPWVRECNYRHEGDRQARTGVVPGTDAPDLPVPVGEPGGLLISVPPGMKQPGYSRIFRASDEWGDVWQGMQCRLRTPGEQEIQFRLTPPGEGTP